MTTPRTTSMLPRLALFVLATGTFLSTAAAAQDLPKGTNVRFQGTPGSELSPGWHTGTTLASRQGCVMVATPDPKMPGGRRVLGLLFIQKLERPDGATWVDVPVKALSTKEPGRCREAVGG